MTVRNLDTGETQERLMHVGKPGPTLAQLGGAGLWERYVAHLLRTMEEPMTAVNMWFGLKDGSWRRDEKPEVME